MWCSMRRTAACIDSDTNKIERRIIIKQFTDGEIDFLFNYGVLTTGFDAPKTRNIVICRPINSTILKKYDYPPDKFKKVLEVFSR